jgi:hypothetical protein
LKRRAKALSDNDYTIEEGGSGGSDLVFSSASAVEHPVGPTHTKVSSHELSLAQIFEEKFFWLSIYHRSNGLG